MKATPIIAILLVLITACAPISPGTPPGDTPAKPDVTYDFGKLSLEPVASEAAYQALFTNSQSYGGLGNTRNLAFAETAVSDGVARPTAAPGLKGDVDFSETNVQVEGVDEADIIKTDGEYIYTISGQQVFILKAYPGKDARELSDIAYENFNPQSLFIDEDRLVVIGSEWNYQGRIGILPQSGYTAVLVYDVSDRKNPELLETYRFEGGLNNARLKDGFVYIATTQWSWYGTPNLPVIARGNSAERLASTSIFIYPYPYDNPVTTLVSSFNVQHLDDPESVGVVTEGSVELYMSNDNIFLASSKNVNTWRILQEITVDIVEPELPASDRSLIKRIRATDNDILSENEKLGKILNIVNQYTQSLSKAEQEQLEKAIERAYEQRISSFDYLQTTLLSRIAYDNGRMDVEADGEVPGTVYSQFAMDERQGILRIATTVDARWDMFDNDARTNSENIVTTLDEDLEMIDQISGIAKTERIFSARFTDHRLYLVTFRQVDPFFVIGIDELGELEMLGELKIPGFSRYLHPFDDETILGLGHDATLQGQQTGLKISVFDVSDVSSPDEIASWKADDSYGNSQAEYDHHAFLFSAARNLLVIPYNAYNWDEKGNNFQGVLVFDVEKDNIDVRGRISHDPESYWRNQIDRSLYIEDLLYTKSYSQVQIHELDSLDHIKTVELSVEDEERYPVLYDDVVFVDEARSAPAGSAEILE